ncbi:MAG: hypothetical protein ACE5FD_19600 [Anaerolineae bacterium]
MTDQVPPGLRHQIVKAIQSLQQRIRWKPGKDTAHLATRIEYGHLPKDAKLADYEAIISHILHSQTAELFVYVWSKEIYPTVSNHYEDRQWIVMFTLDGIMETAFPPTNPAEYLSSPRFRHIGTIQEVL